MPMMRFDPTYFYKALLCLSFLPFLPLQAEGSTPLKSEIKDISSFVVPPIHVADSILSDSIAKDSIFSFNKNIYQEIFDDTSDDLMENHPADDIYLNIWTRERLNPYSMPIDSLPDSVFISCSDFVAPVKCGHITSQFGPRKYRYHFGTDLRVAVGDSIYSSFCGKVRIIDYEARGYGHYVVIRHNNGLETVYAHLSKVLVEHDQELKAGDVLGLGGNTGRSTGPHLHYEIRYLGNAMNPVHLVDFANNKMMQESYLITKNTTFYYNSYLKDLKSAKYYTVRKGDTLGRIASRNGTSVNSICRMNKMSSRTLIRPGQKLRIR